MVETGDRRRWNERYRVREVANPAGPVGSEPNPPRPLERMASLLPPAGVAVDLAGGDGGAALFLGGRGLEPTLVDVSDVALARAESLARSHHLSLRTVRHDLAGRPLGQILTRLGGSSPAIVTCFNYLDRVLLGSIPTELPVGCRFMAAVATTTNLERHPNPSARFLLDPGELADLVVGVGSRLSVLHRREGWADDRHRAEIVVEAR